MAVSKKILVAPLDWGLGHASRCIPIINELKNHSIEVILGGTGLSGVYLRKEFPLLDYHEIPGYEINYSKNLPMAVAMLRQAPGILRSIQEEHNWLNNFIRANQVDTVISDHRYGLYSKQVHSVFMGHQLFISSGKIPMMDQVLWKVNRSYIENFVLCWIPDLHGDINASGKLSHKETIPFEHRFIGLLSKFDNTKAHDKKGPVAFILSGPEPLRTELEYAIVQQIKKQAEGNYILVRGSKESLNIAIPPSLEVIDLATSKELQTIVENAELVVSRAGYSSIMDYLTMNQKALLIPTPGQTEQEYLSKYHQQLGNFHFVEQRNLDLFNDLRIAASYQPQVTNDEELLSNAVSELLEKLN